MTYTLHVRHCTHQQYQSGGSIHSLFNYNRLYVSGHSAGGHITALMLTTQWSDYSLSSFPFAGI